MSRCIIHIGWHKTGTTSIQQTALKHRAVLAGHGIHYPAWHHNHGALLVSAVRSGNLPYYAEQFLLPPKGVGAKSHKEVGLERLRQAVENAGSGTLLLSGEDLNLLDGDEVNAFVALLSPHFSDIRAVAYLRSHAGYANSAGQQMVRMGFTLSEVLDWAGGGQAARSRLRVMGPLPHYGSRLPCWIRALGKANVDVFSFDGLRRTVSDIREHFFTHLFSKEISNLVCGEPAAAANQGLDTKAIHLLDRVNRLQPLFLADFQPNPEIAMFAQSYFADMGSGAFKLPESVLANVKAEAESDLDALAGFCPEALPDMAIPASRDFMPQEQWLGFDRYAQAQGTIPVILRTARGEQGYRARATFFGALASFRHEPDFELLDERLRSSLFQMNDGPLLKSCGGWLNRYGLQQFAALFFKKALNYLPHDAVLRSLERKAREAIIDAVGLAHAEEA
jgi:hypothetical protein